MNPVTSQYEPYESTISRRQGAPAGTMRPSQDIVEYLRQYAREKPEAVALWCFGIGFVLGWKLKPW
jgi:hypothetical protein